MAQILESFEIASPEQGRPFRIDLVQGLDDEHLAYIEEQWNPVAKRQHDLALLEYFTLPQERQSVEAFREILSRLGIPDKHWNWRQKCTFAPGGNRRVYGLLNADHVEAAMLLALGRQARSGGVIGEPIIYVDYLAVAPWNRTAIQNPERFRRLGTLLLGAAVETSRILGMSGRCGLHALPSSEGFYRRLGMTELGIDPSYHGLRYFEFDAASAMKFLGKENV